MSANMNAIDDIQIGEVSCLPENEQYLPSENRNRTG